jgi:hypothetical protein
VITLRRTLFLLFLLRGASVATAQVAGTFESAGNMTTPRTGHTATLLMNGKVLITGGSKESPASAELFDPVTNTFTRTANMTTGRYGNSATLLPDGRVLIVGGYYFGYLDSAEIYDPLTGTFTATGNMPVPQHGGHRAVLLNNGRVLIAGGGAQCLNDGCANVDYPEIYDPDTGAFTIAGDYADKTRDPWFGTYGLVGSPLTLLPDNNVLIAAEPTAELYDPSTEMFRVTGQMTRGVDGRVPGYQIGGTATLLTDGKVFLAGGEHFEWDTIADAELYDPSTGTFTAIGKMSRPRGGHTATLLRDGTVFIAGSDNFFCEFVDGVMRCGIPASADTEFFNPVKGTFTTSANMITGRWNHTATLLMDGRILIAGGYPDAGFSPVRDAELYIPSELIPSPVVKSFQFDRAIVAPGSSYSVEISGSNLTPQMVFDVRVNRPGSNDSFVVVNWQRGLAANHDVPAGIASGSWMITGVRAHEIETDHTGSFFPVSATIGVSR